MTLNLKKNNTMKQDKFIKLVSKSQDNNPLVKMISSDDFLSRYLLGVIINNTDSTTGNVDVDDVLHDLEYAKHELGQAIKAVEKTIK